ncbi:MAG: hypothetical protein PHP65_04995 [Bacilli bacterium]|nr:hypothetical protein [Bacilli bacterium]
MKKKYVKWQKASLIAMVIAWGITFIYTLGFSTGITVLRQDIAVFGYIFKFYDKKHGLSVFTEVIPLIDSYYNNLIKANNLFLYFTVIAFVLVALLFAFGCYRRIRYSKIQNIVSIIGITILSILVIYAMVTLTSLYIEHRNIDFSDYNFVVTTGDTESVLSDNMVINVTTNRNIIGFIIFGIDLATTFLFGYIAMIKNKYAILYQANKQKNIMEENV